MYLGTRFKIFSIAMVNCAQCSLPNAKNHCGKCNKVFYCSRECQVSHWKIHKAQCKVLADPVKGKFTMTKSVQGTRISFGYEVKAISLAARNEFEEAVAAVEKAGISPPVISEAGEYAVKLALVPFDLPSVGMIWLKEALYGVDVPPEIRRVQEIATQITGAPHMFHVFMQKPGHPLTPTLSCKSIDKKDIDAAAVYLSQRYFDSTDPHWTNLHSTHLLHLLEQSYQLDLPLLQQAQAIQERSQSEATWPGKEEEMMAMQRRMEMSSFYKAGEDLYELLSELCRRAHYDSSVALTVAGIDSVLNSWSASNVDNENSGVVTGWGKSTLTADKMADEVTAALEKAVVALLKQVTLPQDMYDIIVAVKPSAASHCTASSTISTPSVSIDSSNNSNILLQSFSTWRGNSYQLSNADICSKIASTAYLNAHLLMTRVLCDEYSHANWENEIVQAAGLYAIVKLLK